MAEVSIEIGGRRHDLRCRDGEEDQLRRLAAIVDEKALQARKSVGGVNEVRQLVLAALLLADEVNDARQGKAPPPPPAADPAIAEALDQLAARVESLADALEQDPASA